MLPIPVARRQHAFFGVPVTPDFYHGAGRRILRRYQTALVFAFAVTLAVELLLLGWRIQPAIATAVPFVGFTAVMLTMYAVGFGEARKVRIPLEERRFASSMRTRRFADYTRLPVEAAILILTVTPIVVLALLYRDLPPRIPVHWNLGGAVDRWTAKSFASAFFLPIVVLYLQAWLLLLKRDSVALKMPLPAERTEEYLEYKQRALRLGWR